MPTPSRLDQLSYLSGAADVDTGAVETLSRLDQLSAPAGSQFNALSTVAPQEEGYSGPIGAFGRTIANVRERFTGKADWSTSIDSYWTGVESQLDGPLEKRGMPDFRTSALIRAADNPEEQRMVFEKRYPFGSLEYLPGTNHLVYKEDASNVEEPWKTVQRFDEVAGEGGSRAMQAALAGFAAKYAPVVAGEIAGLALTKRSPFITRTAASSLGAFTGEGGRQVGQTIAGIQADTGLEQLKSAGIEGTIAGIGFGVSEPLVRTFNVLRGAGGFRRMAGADDAMEAIESLNAQTRILNASRPADQQLPYIDRLTPGQALTSPIFKRLESQAAALAGPLKEYREGQARALGDALLRDIDYAAIARAPDAVKTALERAEQNLIRSINNPNVTTLQAGESLGLLRYYAEESQNIVRSAYAEAAQYGTPTFDLDPAIGVFRRLNQGMPRPALPDPDGISQLIDPTGSPFRRPSPRPDVQVDPASSELKDVLGKLERLDPAGVDLDALIVMRQQLYDLKTPLVGMPRNRQNAIASEAYEALTNVIKNPTNQADNFVAAWERANGLAAQRFNTLDKALISNIMRADQELSMQTLSALADSLIAPNKSEQINFLRSLGPRGEEAVKALQETFETQILDNVLDPAAASRIISNIKDRPTLEALIPNPARRQQFATLINNVEQLQSSGVAAARQAQDQAQPLISQMLTSGSSADMTFLRGLINDAGGLDSELGKAIRHGLKDHIAEVAIQAGGRKEVQSAALNDEIKRLSRMGMMGLLTPDDRVMLRDLSKVIDFFSVTRGTADAGTSIRAMEITSDLYNFTDGGKVAGALVEIMKAFGVSRFMLSDTGRMLLLGKAGTKYSEIDPLRLATMVTGAVLADQEQQQ